MTKRTLDELINKEEPGWQFVLEWIEGAKNRVEVLPAKEPNRSEALLGTQVTTRSPMGAIIYETGGLLIDDGWIRILGSGCERLTRSLPEWNKTATGVDLNESATFVLIADDVLGGFFAIDGSEFGDPGKVFYLAPDSLEWENTGLGYSQFVDGFCFNGDLADYYSPHKTENWTNEFPPISCDEAFSFYPPLWASPVVASERENLERSIAPVPISETYSLAIEHGKKLASLPEGTVVRLTVED